MDIEDYSHKSPNGRIAKPAITAFDHIYFTQPAHFEEPTPAVLVALGWKSVWDMGKADEYRRNAASCLQLVDKTSDPAERTFLLDMARAWHNLADQAERNSRSDLFYETPPRAPAPRPPAPQQPVTQQQQQIQPDIEKKEES